MNPDEERDRREPWAYLFDEETHKSELVEVHLSNDDQEVITGRWERKTWSEDKRELYLQNPQYCQIEDYQQDLETLEDVLETEVGRGIYLSPDEIGRVVLSLDDPGTRVKGTDQDTEIVDQESDIESEIEDIISDFEQSAFETPDQTDLSDWRESEDSADQEPNSDDENPKNDTS
ncbi:hypothetical protein [Halospeciosus flavus]|uniref:Uncharacterized protein n=2 Tax=Halospeciosus flavus TaxID=3032283 RepID=A0ABD5Z9J8_9EURY|nr:hypothetical protein [Halospeciosus flavus]